MGKDNCFVKISYDTVEKETNVKHSDAKINCLNDKGLSGKYLIGGGVYNRNSGCFVFKAKDVEEAKKLASNNSFIKQKAYEYKNLSVTMFT
ncbi:hypothetical protein [Haloimpatiens lingqiaonensis]|uniref:hypothetical protein n=1 Tax=Haloimpatiens lingqiaonensis TaxID=1380675 RepID=UPI0010FF1D11|nr:hypothetical protein [Haloimpatiens lingqiaonensis]